MHIHDEEAIAVKEKNFKQCLRNSIISLAFSLVIASLYVVIYGFSIESDIHTEEFMEAFVVLFFSGLFLLAALYLIFIRSRINIDAYKASLGVVVRLLDDNRHKTRHIVYVKDLEFDVDLVFSYSDFKDDEDYKSLKENDLVRLIIPAKKRQLNSKPFFCLKISRNYLAEVSVPYFEGGNNV